MLRQLVAAFAVVAALAAVVSPAVPASAHPSVIRLISITTSQSSVDVPPRNASVGDSQRFTSRLVNARAQFGKPKGAVVGSDRGTIRLTSAMRANLRTVAKLPGGTLTVSGLLRTVGKGGVSIPVVAGTGIFTGARGTLTIPAPTSSKSALNIYRLSYGPIA